MVIKLKTITLHNFKGIRDMTLTLDGRDATIFGSNGAGKTTIVDAFLWLLFNKDSENRGQFEVKTLDANNKPIHNLEHEVEAVLEVDGRKVTLRKLYKEIWKRTRGRSDQVFDGHTTDYWVNEEPFKAKEYQAYVSALIDDEKFRLITNPLYFSTKLHWEERRKTLLALCGEITPEAIISAAGEDVEGLSELLDGRTVETVRKIVMDRRRLANDELEKIPAQIEAVTRTLPVLLDDYTPIQDELEDCKDKVKELDARMHDASKALEPIREKGKELGRLEQERSSLLSRLERESRAGYEETKEKRERDERRLKTAESSVESHGETIKRLRIKKLDLDTELKELRVKHEEEYQTAYTEPSADELICRSCGQDLPVAKRTELLNEARDRFDRKRTDTLKAIEGKGITIKEVFDKTERELDNAVYAYDEALAECEKLKNSIELTKITEENLKPSETIDFSTNPEVVALVSKIAALQAELEAPPADETASISQQRSAVNSRMAELMQRLSERDATVHSKAVIAELTSRERQLSDQIAEYDGQLYMLDTYVRTEARLLEGNINSKFKTISFKLFEEQINGGLRPTCEAVIGGVHFSEANTAGQFNAGMEIIDALCAHYDVYAPVFVDRCESINSLTPIESQVIRMVVAKDSEMALTLGMPGITTTKAARGDISIKIENSEKETS